MCTDLGPQIQEKCAPRILPALMAAMDDFSHPRVQAHAAAAVVNFSEGAEQDLLPPHLDTLITKLLLLLQHGKKLVQEGALTAMASVADCSQSLFIKYYDTVMPLLLSILSGANDKAHRLLRGKALECVSLVGMAVGRDRFREDAARVLQWLQALQASEMDADDPTLGYMLQAGARLCKCLGQEFLPYLPIVMPPLIKSATLEADIKIHDADDEDDVEEDDDDVEHIRMGDKLVAIRTSSLEEKATACNMLCCYADELKDGFFPYVKQVADIMVPLLKFWLHEEVRRAAVQTLPELLRSAVLCVEKGSVQDPSVVKQLLDYFWPAMMDALGKEPDADVQGAMMDSITEIVELVGVLGGWEGEGGRGWLVMRERRVAMGFIEAGHIGVSWSHDCCCVATCLVCLKPTTGSYLHKGTIAPGEPTIPCHPPIPSLPTPPHPSFLPPPTQVDPGLLAPEYVGLAFERFSRILKEAEERRQERLKRTATEDFDAE